LSTKQKLLEHNQRKHGQPSNKKLKSNKENSGYVLEYDYNEDTLSEEISNDSKITTISTNSIDELDDNSKVFPNNNQFIDLDLDLSIDIDMNLNTNIDKTLFEF
jgi:hypothetical protein